MDGNRWEVVRDGQREAEMQVQRGRHTHIEGQRDDVSGWERKRRKWRQRGRDGRRSCRNRETTVRHRETQGEDIQAKRREEKREGSKDNKWKNVPEGARKRLRKKQRREEEKREQEKGKRKK